MIKISIIIPAFNCENTIEKCLDAISLLENQIHECIVVMDGPNDNLRKLIQNYNVNLKILEKKLGPSHARNFGSTNASGDILFFLDSDVIIHKDSISILKDSFQDPNISIIQGMYTLEPANSTFSAKFASLKKWVDFKPDETDTFSTIGSAIFAIRREIFFEFNGFNENYNSNTVEDYEFGHRINEKYTITFNKNLKGKHFFPPMKKILYNYYRRAKEWTVLFDERKKFDSGAASKKGAYSALTTSILSIFIINLLLSLCITSYYFMFYPSVVLIAICLIIFTVFNYPILKKANSTYGICFSIKTYFSLILLYIAVMCSLPFSIISIIKKRFR